MNMKRCRLKQGYLPPLDLVYDEDTRASIYGTYHDPLDGGRNSLEEITRIEDWVDELIASAGAIK